MGKKTHTAIIEWDGYSWIATPDTGGVIQVRRLDFVRRRLSEVARLVTGEKVDPDQWTLLIHFAGKLGEEPATGRDFRARVEAEQDHLTRMRRPTAAAVRHRGTRLRTIGGSVGRTHQRARKFVATRAQSKTKKASVRHPA